MSAVVVVAEPRAAAHDRVPIFVLIALLEQLRDVITLLPASAYRAQPAARVSGSVGEHVRHCLDHVSSLAEAVAGEELSYDHRRRGTTVETDPTSAVNEIERILRRIDRLAVGSLDKTVRLSALLHPEHASFAIRSTLARELAFVIQHTIHHFALIAVLLEWQGWHVPHGFGVAPSTARTRGMAG
jgi:uncharacterized damage-inducible protein DinB